MRSAVVQVFLKTAAVFYLCEAQILQELRRINMATEELEGLEDYTELTMDQILTQALGGIDVAAQKMLSPGGHILAELDMNITEDLYHMLYSAPVYGALETMPYFENRRKRRSVRSDRKKRKAVRRIDLRWPKGVIPYTFATNHFTDKEIYTIKIAMREWEKYTCIKFREAASGDRNYVRFQNGPGCNSQLGMVGGMQVLNLDVNGCRWKGLYLHEIGHAIGLVHEHQLPNRDEYISILYHNVAPSMRVWFQKYTNNQVNQFDINYQLSSVMHYGTTAFSADGRSTTIRPKNASNTDSIGKVWRKELAFSDVKTVNRMYECAAHCSSQNVQCRGGGFLDQNCKCICPDGTEDCQLEAGAPTVRPHSRDGDCVNMYDNWQCNVWAKQGECEVNPKFMKVSCKKACNVCGSGVPGPRDNHLATFAWQWLGMFADIFPSDWGVDDCEDLYKDGKCKDWADNGDCLTSVDWMNKNCKKSCGQCGKEKKPKTGTVVCKDDHSDIGECEKWARKGECKINKAWMNKNCKKTCKFCDALVSDEPKVKPRQEYEDDDDGTVNDTDPDNDQGSCTDKHNTRECRGWASKGECERNPGWMVPNCRQSCKKCDDGTCKNLYDDKKCRRWARDRECMKNPVWMHDNCAKSCNTCNKGSKDDDDDDSTRVGRRGNNGGSNDRNDNSNNVPKDDPSNGGTVCKNDHKNDKDCNTWAKYGHCRINPSYMHKNCKLACGVCTPREDTNAGRNDRQNDGSHDESRGGQQTTTTRRPMTTTRTYI
ncbi:hypothetical protein FSP39_009149 [Pinctada imbricata]|uniref:Metalloendopeptidase n=1 Tax=Pinctada imbricata TaxID=66713 RepID=A0AA89C0Y0_PINIB|nr:hypothetical protein FSP39_009149 [Pinctada imbricata]